jgi:hypothetical protein
MNRRGLPRPRCALDFLCFGRPAAHGTPRIRPFGAEMSGVLVFYEGGSFCRERDVGDAR